MSDQPTPRRTSPLRIIPAGSKSAPTATTPADGGSIAVVAPPAYTALTPEELGQSLSRMAQALQASERGAEAPSEHPKTSGVAVSSLSSLASGKKKAGTTPVGGLLVKREAAVEPLAAPAPAPQALPRRGRGDVPT